MSQNQRGRKPPMTTQSNYGRGGGSMNQAPSRPPMSGGINTYGGGMQRGGGGRGRGGRGGYRGGGRGRQQQPVQQPMYYNQAYGIAQPVVVQPPYGNQQQVIYNAYQPNVNIVQAPNNVVPAQMLSQQPPPNTIQAPVQQPNTINNASSAVQSTGIPSQSGSGGGGQAIHAMQPNNAPTIVHAQQQPNTINNNQMVGGGQGQSGPSGGKRRPPLKQPANNAMFDMFAKKPINNNLNNNAQGQPINNAPIQQPVSASSNINNNSAQVQNIEKTKVDNSPVNISNSDNAQTEASSIKKDETNENTVNDKDPSSVTPQSSPPKRRSSPPWEEFVGKEKRAPIRYGWAHRVRSIFSADTVRLSLLRNQNESKLEPAKTIQITLDGIYTPRCVRNNPNNPNYEAKQERMDDPFAFEAREFVRNFVTSKNVFFAVWKEISSRSYGDIYVQTGKNKKESLTQVLVRHGFAYIKTSTQNELSGKESEKLNKAQEEAKKNKLKVWSYDWTKNGENMDQIGKANTRSCVWIRRERDRDLPKDPSEDPLQYHEGFTKEYKGQTLHGIVDQILNGSTVRIELELQDKNFDRAMVIMNMAGVLAPRKPFVNNRRNNRNNKGGKDNTRGGKSSPPQRRYNNNNNRNPAVLKFVSYAQEWTEERLLGQKVSVRILFCENKNIYAQITHPGGRIGPSLLKKGLAEYEAWSASACDASERKLLSEASAAAQKAKLNIWGVKKKPSRVVMVVTVVQVVSGDTIIVRNADSPNVTVRYTLSSIRSPKLGNIRRGNYEARPEEYLAREAREHLRQKLIGKTVKLVFEYDRDSNFKDNQTKKDITRKQLFASVYVDDGSNGLKNVALEMVEKGLCSIIPHGKTQPRSADYMQLSNAFRKAKAKHVGIHIGEKKAIALLNKSRITDFSIQSDIKDYERVQLRQALVGHKLKAVVEFIFSGNRLKLYLPEKRACIAVMLADIRCGGFGSGYSKLAGEAKLWMENTIQQRDVEVLITRMDQSPQRGGYNSRGRGRGRGRGGGRGGRGGRGGGRGGKKKGKRGRDRGKNNNKDGNNKETNDEKQNDGNKDGKKKEKEKVEETYNEYAAPVNRNFLGHVLIDGKNVSEYLIEKGLATVIVRRYNNSSGLIAQQERLATPAIFKELENEAKRLQIGIHQIVARDLQKDDKNLAKKYQEICEKSLTSKETQVCVSHIESATLFYVNLANNDSMDKMNFAMEDLRKNAKIPVNIREGKRYAALYDNYYARAKVNNVDRRPNTSGNNWFVTFIDYGNRASIARRQFAVLPDALRIDKIAPLALRCELAGIRAPEKSNAYYGRAGNFFAQKVMSSDSQKLKMKVLYDCDDDEYMRAYPMQGRARRAKKLFVELFVGDESINKTLAREGYVRMSKKEQLPEGFEKPEMYDPETKMFSKNQELIQYIADYNKDIKDCTEQARNAHLNIWEYGNVDSAEEEDNLGAFDAKNKKKKK